MSDDRLDTAAGLAGARRLDQGVVLLPGDCRQVLAELARAGVRVDAVVTDPPYHLTSIVKRFGAPGAAPARAGKTGAYARASKGFMGKQWDGGDIAFDPQTWKLVAAVLKPGGHLAAFSGTRTYHRMAVAIEQAGFELRDMLAWLYGSGFPKSHDVAKGIDKAARQYLPGSEEARAWEGWGTALKPAQEPIAFARKPLAAGSVAANVLQHGTGAINVDGCRVPIGEERPSGSGAVKSATVAYGDFRGNGGNATPESGRWPANVLHDGSEEVLQAFGGGEARPARFFYSAKADAAERIDSKHPTVKPLDLMRWLVRLITPPGGLVLDPFAGTGTTGAAALREGFGALLIEREAEYQGDIARRFARITGADSPLFAGLTQSETETPE